MRIVIIGAGPCGLGAAHRLNELGHTDFKVYDSNNHVGGLATSFYDEKGFTWDIAVHVAHSHYHYVDKLMDSLLPDGFYHHIRMSWVREYGTFIPYPFQNNIRHLPHDERQECVDGLLKLRDHKGPTPPVTNFKEWILATAGEGIAKHFMVPYNKKIWTVDPSQMNHTWLGDRVPKVDVERVLRNIAEGRDDVAWGPNSTFQFPKTGGTGAIWNEMARRLPEGCIKLSTSLVKLDAKNKVAEFSDGTVEKYDHLISTMPIVKLTAMIGDKAIHSRASQLKHTRVYVVCLAPNFKIPKILEDKTWVYCPEDRCIFYRVTPFSIFSPAHVPDPEKWCSFLCEISATPDKHYTREYLTAETVKGLREIGLVDIDLANAHTNFIVADYGYPIPTVDRDPILNDVLPKLHEMNIYSRGRFGGWKYEVANMDHSIMQGVEAANRILLGEEEITLFQPSVVNAGKR